MSCVHDTVAVKKKFP